MHHRVVKLKLSDRPLRCLLLWLDGGAAVDGVSTEGHPGALSWQAVETGGVSIKVMRHHQDPRAVAAPDGYASCGGGS